MASDLRETRVGGQELFKGDFLHAMRDRVRLPDGQLTQREYIVHPGAVMIVPWLQGPDGSLQLVLERQYRYPVQQTIVEFPAGKLDPGEAPLVCAQRELREETGHQAKHWRHLATMHPCIGYADERIEIWFARGLTVGERRLDEGEFLDVFAASEQQLSDWIRDGELTDAKTMIALLWLQQWRAGRWALDWRPAEAWSRGR